jgi:hypothetical protein
MMRVLYTLFARPSSFPNDPYGYLCNQLGHGVLGCMLTTALAWAALHLTGWWPPQWIVVVAVVFSYAIVWEYGIQGWLGWDSFEDTLFVFYGASMYLFIDMYFVIDRLFGFWLGAAALLSYGVTKRLKRGRFNE